MLNKGPPLSPLQASSAWIPLAHNCVFSIGLTSGGTTELHLFKSHALTCANWSVFDPPILPEIILKIKKLSFV